MQQLREVLGAEVRAADAERLLRDAGGDVQMAILMYYSSMEEGEIPMSMQEGARSSANRQQAAKALEEAEKKRQGLLEQLMRAYDAVDDDYDGLIGKDPYTE